MEEGEKQHQGVETLVETVRGLMAVESVKMDNGKPELALLPYVTVMSLRAPAGAPRSEKAAIWMLKETLRFGYRKRNSLKGVKECALRHCLEYKDYGHWSGLVAQAYVMAFGAKKYKKWNWQLGMPLMRYVNAIMRHLLMWTNDPVDPESGQNHMAHVLCNISFIEHIMENKEAKRTFDDRWSYFKQ